MELQLEMTFGQIDIGDSFIVASHGPEQARRMTKIGPQYALVEGSNTAIKIDDECEVKLTISFDDYVCAMRTIVRCVIDKRDFDYNTFCDECQGRKFCYSKGLNSLIAVKDMLDELKEDNLFFLKKRN